MKIVVWFARPVVFVLSHTPGHLKDSTLPFHPGAESCVLYPRPIGADFPFAPQGAVGRGGRALAAKPPSRGNHLGSALCGPNWLKTAFGAWRPPAARYPGRVPLATLGIVDSLPGRVGEGEGTPLLALEEFNGPLERLLTLARTQQTRRRRDLTMLIFTRSSARIPRNDLCLSGSSFAMRRGRALRRGSLRPTKSHIDQLEFADPKQFPQKATGNIPVAHCEVYAVTSNTRNF